jgi:hypothetical protein
MLPPKFVVRINFTRLIESQKTASVLQGENGADIMRGFAGIFPSFAHGGPGDVALVYVGHM